MFSLSKRSLKNLEGVNQKLVDVVKLAITISKQDFTVIEGLRSIETQKQYVAKGVSKTMNSYHLTGHAVDIYPFYNGSVQCEAPFSKFKLIKEAMFTAAKELRVVIEWGGDWKSFCDSPHFQIPRK